jgi:hypothetical protein
MLKSVLLAAALGIPVAANAATVTYDFSNTTAGTVPAANSAPDAGVKFLGTTTVGAVGQDNWIWTSSTGNVYGEIVRNDQQNLFSGNWISSYPSATATPSYDSINSRKNDASFSYAIPAGATFSVGARVLIASAAATAVPQTAYTSRAVIGLGYDQNNDGDVRGDAVNAENAEWGPLFGYETGSSGQWYVRPASLGTAVTFTAPSTGVWNVRLDIDPSANSGDGAGTLMIQQLIDGNGNAVADSFHAASASLTNVNLLLKRMNVVASGGTANGPNPAFWNGIIARAAGNGGIDDITITYTPEPASLAVMAGAAVIGLRRRR